MRMIYHVTGGGTIPRLILDYEDKSETKRYSLWCKQVPPPAGGKFGELVFPNVERRKDGYEFISFKRLKNDEFAPNYDDIHIYLKSDPSTSGYIELPHNGGDTDNELTIKLGVKPVTLPPPPPPAQQLIKILENIISEYLYKFIEWGQIECPGCNGSVKVLQSSRMIGCNKCKYMIEIKPEYVQKYKFE